MKVDLLDQIRDIIQEDVGRRGLRSKPEDNLITACFDDFHRACESLAQTPHPSLAVLTGFYIATANPPSGETDGPLGALFLARALVPLGFRIVLVTDGFCRGTPDGPGSGRPASGTFRSSPCPIMPAARLWAPRHTGTNSTGKRGR